MSDERGVGAVSAPQLLRANRVLFYENQLYTRARRTHTQYNEEYYLVDITDLMVNRWTVTVRWRGVPLGTRRPTHVST